MHWGAGPNFRSSRSRRDRRRDRSRQRAQRFAVAAFEVTFVASTILVFSAVIDVLLA